jgi:hypothetical protein
MRSRTCVRYPGSVGTWHDPEVGRPIAAPLERCAELLGVDLPTVHELAGKIEPYVRADGTRIWSLMQLERQLRPEAYGRRRGRLPRPPTDPGRRYLVLQPDFVIWAGQSVIGARERPPLIIWRCANNKDQTVAAGPSIDPTRWQQTLDELLGRIAGHFARVEPRRRAAAFVCGLLAELPRKNCWTLAEHAGDPTPDGMQHLLSGAVWDEHAVRDDVRDYVVEHLGDPQGCWWWTRAGTARRARPRWGGSPVHRHQRQGRQRPGRGLPGLRQPGRHAVVDRELYVPRGWIADRDRRAAAGVPEQLGFGTKPEWPG